MVTVQTCGLCPCGQVSEFHWLVGYPAGVRELTSDVREITHSLCEKCSVFEKEEETRVDFLLFLFKHFIFDSQKSICVLGRL